MKTFEIFFRKRTKKTICTSTVSAPRIYRPIQSCISLSQRLEPLLGLMRFSLFFNWCGTRGFTTRTEVYFGKCIVDEHMFLRRDDAFRKIYFQLDGIANELDEARFKKS